MSTRFWPVVAIVGGLALGAVDLLLQRTLPYPWANLANSSAVWAIAAFVFGRRLGRERGWWRSAVGAALLLVVAVEAYYLTATLTMDDDLNNLWAPSTFVWLVGGVCAGLLFGAAGALSVRAGGWLRAAAAAMPSAVLLAEALVLADRFRVSTRPDQHDYRIDSFRTAIIEAVLGVLLLIVFSRGIRGRASIAAVVLALLGFLTFRVVGF